MPQGLNGFDDAKKGAVLSDDANRRYADLLVDPLAFLSEGDGDNSYWGWGQGKALVVSG
jgi:hypothetical protein